MTKHAVLAERLSDLSNVADSLDCDAMREAAQAIEALERDGPEVEIGEDGNGSTWRGSMRTAWQLSQAAAHAEAARADELQRENAELRKAKEHAETMLAVSCNHGALEQLRVKAARYDWLRDVADPDSETSGICVSEADINDWGNKFTRYFSGDALDAAIDAAMQKEGERDG